MHKKYLLSFSKSISFLFIAPLIIAITLITLSADANSDQADWMQGQTNAKDVSISHNGNQWYVDQDGRAYQWNAQTSQWNTHGTRSNFDRIDAGNDGAVAITTNGQVYVTFNTQKSWQATGITASDAGVGGGKVWLASAKAKGKTSTLTGTITNDGKIDWQTIDGVLSRIDVDLQGQAWGIDKNGLVFVYADGAWINDDKAPKMSDIAVGGNGALYAVGTDFNKDLGGARVYQRDAVFGAWSQVPGRLIAITVNENGQAVGVNSKNWLIAGTQSGAENIVFGSNDQSVTTQTPNGELPNEISVVREGDMTLADILGTAVPGASKVKLSKVEITPDTIIGTVELNGSPVRTLLHHLDPKDVNFVAGLAHESIDLLTYIPQLRNSNIGSFGLGNTVFYVQPDDADAIDYASIDDMPKPLADLIEKQKDFSGLFPLTIHPGVTVIGAYESTNNKAKTIMAIYGMTETGYVAKGHFKFSQLQNVNFDINIGGTSASKKPTKDEMCKGVTNLDLSGLDLSFPIPGFNPPYVMGAIEFEKSTFSLKEIDGQIETAIVSAMTWKLPEKQIGIKDIPLAGKLSVQSSLDVLCDGIDKKTNAIIGIAASTSFNVNGADELSYNALSQVTDKKLKAPTEKDLGWKKAFGIPFLTIRHYASAGIFEQKDGKHTLSTSMWADAKTDRADLDLRGSVDYELTPQEMKVTDWSFETEGPIALNDLPTLKDIPKIDELTLKDISLTPSEMVGTLLRQNKDLSATAYIAIDEKENQDNEYDLFASFGNLTPSAIYDFIPKSISDVTLSSAFIGWSNKAKRELKYSDAPEKLKPLLSGLIAEDDSITIVNGMTLGGLTTPDEIFKGKFTDLFKDYITIEGGVRLLGGFVMDQTKKMTGELRATLDKFSLKNVPASLITFKDTDLVLSNLDTNKVSFETVADVTIPEKKDPVPMNGTLVFEQSNKTDNSLEITLASNTNWNTPLSIPALKIDVLGFEAGFKKENSKTKSNIGFFGDGTFRKQNGRIGVILEEENGTLEGATATFEGSLKLSELMNIPTRMAAIADTEIRKLMISRNAIAGDLTFNLNGLSFDGRGAVVEHNGKTALFLNQDTPLEVGKIVPNVPEPLKSFTIPKGLLIISPEEIESFDASTIADAIYDEILGDLIADDQAYALKVEDGLTFYTTIDTKNLPTTAKTILKKPFGISGEVPVAGSVGGLFGNGDPSVGFYTVLKNVTPSLPDFVEEFIAFKNGNASVFVQSIAGTTGSLKVGIATDVTIKPRRLDDPSVVQPLDGAFALTYEASPVNTSITASASVKGAWQDPMGLDGYSLKNPSFSFGTQTKGTTIGIHTDRAEFTVDGQVKAFIFDLDTTWAGGVPTDLAVQMSKTKDTAELILTPITMARLQKSMFDLAFGATSKLGTAVSSKLGGPYKPAFKAFSELVSGASDGMFSLIEKSPLSMIGVKNPVIYFGTPGSTPPSNPDIDTPPLGLGLEVSGIFNVDTGALKADLAGGSYKVNIVDGYAVRGSVKPPSPFASNRITVAGNMPLIGGAQFLRFSGNLEVPGAEIAGISLGASGNFDMTRGSMLDRNASIAADISIGGVLDRQGSMALNGTTLSFDLPGGCTDIPPLDLKGSIPLGSLDATVISDALIASLIPSIPDPVECAGDLVQAFKDIGEGAFNAGKDFVNDPAGSAGAVGEFAFNAGEELLTNPGAVLDNAANLVTMPLDIGEALAGAGINLVKMGVDKIPVLGPGAAKAIGAVFDKASELKDAAVDALTNNAVSGFLNDSFGAAAGAVTNVASSVGNAAKEFFTGGSDDAPVWYRVNPLRCETGHYWNEIFTKCFENGAMVLFDESTRGTGNLGDCMRTRYITAGGQSSYPKDAVHVGVCSGNGSNQFHLDSITDQIKAVRRVYNGYDGRFYGPNYNGCLTRRATTTDNFIANEVYIDRCSTSNDNQKWTYTEDLKLQNSGLCVTRNASNKLVLGSCAAANQWLGTSVVANWNEAEGVPVRGQITHMQSGRCMNWHSGGPHNLVECSHREGLEQDKRSHVRLRVLDGNNTVSIMGSRAWDNSNIYGCIGLIGGANDDRVMARHCWPNLVYEEAKWKVWPIINKEIDQSGSIPLKDVLKNHEYVFKNVKNNKCLSASMTDEEINDPKIRPWVGETTYCIGSASGYGFNRNVNNTVRFKNYEPDRIAQFRMDQQRISEQQIFEAERAKARPAIYEWQKFRVRRENARISAVQKMSETFNTSIRSDQIKRQSPGQCEHGEFWNQYLKRCSKDSRMLLHYHDSQGNRLGCIQSDNVGYYGLRLKQSCPLDGEYDAVIDTFAFFFDDKGRIVKKNSEYWADVRKQTDQDGKEAYFNTGSIEVEKSDTCLTVNRGVTKIDGLMPLDFMYCNSVETSWRYSPQGELVSPDGLCVRTKEYQDKGTYSLTNVRTYDRLFSTAQAEIYNRIKGPNQAKWDAVKTGRLAYAARMGDEGRWSTVYNNGEYTTEITRLEDLHGVTALKQVIKAEEDVVKASLKAQYPTFITATKTNFVLDDCANDPMISNAYRIVPTMGVNFTQSQELPDTAKISPANDPSQCLTADLYIGGDITVTQCANDNKDQYFAFGGTDQTRFLISSRNSKTCLYDAGDNKVYHRPCRGSGAEMFMQIKQDNGSVKIQNALSGQCLSRNSSDTLIQASCDNATALKLNVVESIENIEFATMNKLQPVPEKLDLAQTQWQKAKDRAGRLYMGVYLQHGDRLLTKGGNDQPVMNVETATIQLEPLLSHTHPKTAEKVYLPAVDALKTSILLLPGFEDGANHVTFAHARTIQFTDDKPDRDNVTDPVLGHYEDWYPWGHKQKVMIVTDGGQIAFDYITEDNDFRQSATFEMVQALSGDADKHSFRSIKNPGQYLQYQNGTLVLGNNANAASFSADSTSKWRKSKDLNIMTMAPPLRAHRPRFESWTYPETTGIFQMDY